MALGYKCLGLEILEFEDSFGPGDVCAALGICRMYWLLFLVVFTFLFSVTFFLPEGVVLGFMKCVRHQSGLCRGL